MAFVFTKFDDGDRWDNGFYFYTNQYEWAWFTVNNTSGELGRCRWFRLLWLWRETKNRKYVIRNLCAYVIQLGLAENCARHHAAKRKPNTKGIRYHPCCDDVALCRYVLCFNLVSFVLLLFTMHDIKSIPPPHAIDSLGFLSSKCWIAQVHMLWALTMAMRIPFGCTWTLLKSIAMLYTKSMSCSHGRCCAECMSLLIGRLMWHAISLYWFSIEKRLTKVLAHERNFIWFIHLTSAWVSTTKPILYILDMQVSTGELPADSKHNWRHEK